MRVRVGDARVHVRLTETEAYGGSDDEASHAHGGRSARNSSMFGPAGHLYVYRIYGMHWCMNVVTGRVGQAGAVLLRSADVEGVDVASSLRGPGLLTRFLGVTGADDGVDCCRADSRLSFHSTGGVGEVLRSPRIGISRERERPSRYYLAGAVVSRPRGRTDRTA